MFLSVIALVLACWCSGAHAQFPYLGKCPNVRVQEDFDIERFKGQWFEIERTMSFLEIGATCVSVNFTDEQHDQGVIEVINEGRSRILKLRKKVRLTATIPDHNETAKMVLRMNDLSLFGNYWILSTDYDSYALVYSCNHIWLTFRHAYTENLWILSRERTLSQERSDALHALLQAGGEIKARRLLGGVNQNNCD